MAGCSGRRLTGSRALVTALAALAVVGAPARAGSLTITAREIRADDATGLAVAEGEVRISDGTTTALGQRLVLDTRKGTAVLTSGTVRGTQGVLRAREITLRLTSTRLTEAVARGEARIETRRGELSADEITLALPQDRMTASGHVRLRAPPDVLATGSRLTYDGRSKVVTLIGPARIETRQGTVTARRLEGVEGLQQIRLLGDVQARFRDIAAQAEEATLLVPAQKVILTGAVRVTQRGQTLEGTVVTIFYGARRVIAEGPTRLRFEESAPVPAR